MVGHLEDQGEAMLPVLTQTAPWVSELAHAQGTEIRRIIDIGSGPGVSTCEWALQCADATVLAVDGSVGLLERAAQRAARLGVADRVETRVADLAADLDNLDRADLIWASMVVHHVGDEVDMIRRLGALLEPSGLLAIVEFGEPMRFLPDDLSSGGVALGQPGLMDRLLAANEGWFAEMRASLPGATESADHGTMIEAAGLELVGHRVVPVRHDAPLSAQQRRIALGHLQRSRKLAAERLGAEDNEVIAVLMDPDHPQGVMHRPDVFLHTAPNLYVARA